MFKTFSTMTLFGLLTLSAAQAQSEQPIHAKVPFAFTVQNMTLPAGTYRLSYNNTGHILSIRGLDEDSTAAFASAFPLAPATGPGKLIFHCYGKGCYLAELSNAPSIGGPGLSLLRTEQERKLALLTRVTSITIPAR